MNILFGWEIGGGMGHLSPHYTLFEALLARGHKLFVAARRLDNAQRAFAGLDVTCLEAPGFLKPPTQPFLPTFNYAQVLYNAGLHSDKAIANQAGAWDQIVQQTSPGLVLSDAAPTLHLSLRGKHIPLATLSTGFFVPPPDIPLPLFWTLAGAAGAHPAPSDRPLLDSLNRVLSLRAQPALQRIADLFHENVTAILKTYKQLDHYPMREHGMYMGSPPNRSGGKSPEWPPGSGPKIYCYLKPTAGMPRAVAEIASLGWPTIVVSDRIPQKVQQLLSKPNLSFVNEHLDLEQVSAHCAVAVNNANHGTTAHFLNAGIPLLSLPIHLEQQLIAAAVTKLGAGCSIDPKVGAGAARAVTLLAQNPSFKAASKNFSAANEHLRPPHQLQLALGELSKISQI